VTAEVVNGVDEPLIVVVPSRLETCSAPVGVD
jgi:hypothetical protein